MRLRHRLRVVQSLEDSVSRNVVRSIVSDGFFRAEELQVNKITMYFGIFSRVIFAVRTSWRWFAKSSCANEEVNLQELPILIPPLLIMSYLK
jgi:hypothetical protein